MTKKRIQRSQNSFVTPQVLEAWKAQDDDRLYELLLHDCLTPWQVSLFDLPEECPFPPELGAAKYWANAQALRNELQRLHPR